MKRVVRNELDKLSTELFGVKSYWNTFKKSHNLDDEKILSLFMALRKRLPKFEEFRKELDKMLVDEEKVYINIETGALGIPKTKFINNIMTHGMEYPKVFEILFKEIPNDGFEGWFLKTVVLIKRDDSGDATTEVDFEGGLTLIQDAVD